VKRNTEDVSDGIHEEDIASPVLTAKYSAILVIHPYAGTRDNLRYIQISS
jgi:hypothetical protein